MKLLSLCLTLLASFFANSADIQVNNSGQSGTYTTITAAVNAASTGDRIFISPYNQYTENLSITKSLTLTSAVSNTRFSVVGNTTVTSAPNQEVTIIGGEFIGSFIGSTGTATNLTKGKISIVDCLNQSLTVGNYILSNIFFSTVLSTITMENGKIIGSKYGNIVIQDGPSSNVGDTLSIIGNIGGGIEWNSNDHFFHFYNNFISGNPAIRFNNSCYSSTVNNIICNNTISGGSNYSVAYATVTFPLPSGSNMSNILLTNNIIQNPGNSAMAITCGIQYPNGAGDQSLCNSNVGLPKLYYNYIMHTNINNSGIYASDIVGNTFAGTAISFDNFGKPLISNSLISDKGMPSIIYYDIDLSRNDIGTSGGPYSIDNYWNTASGRARIYNLDIPFEIWNGNTPSVKADGIHIK